MPYPCTTRTPSRSATKFSTSLPSGAAPLKTASKLERSNLSTSGCLASASTMGGTKYKFLALCCWISPRKDSRSNLGSVTTVLPIASMVLSST